MESEILTNVHSTADQYYEKQVVRPTGARVHAAELDTDEEEYFPLQPIEKKTLRLVPGSGADPDGGVYWSV